MRALLCLVLLGACTTFDPIEANICGNGILEPGEDCDSTDATCVACAITCSTAACPAGYACGIDRVCHGAGGQLGEGKLVDTVSVSDFRITDVDHDGIADFLGLSPTSITVRHGATANPLVTNESYVTPGQTGTPAFGDLDGDGSLDFMVPTPDGLVTYTSKYGQPSPIAIPSSLVGKSVEIVDIIPLQPLVIGMFLAAVPTTQLPHPDLQLMVIDFADPTSPALLAPQLCQLHTALDAFDVATVDVYDAGGNSPGSDQVISFLVDKKPCVLALHLEPPTAPRVTVVPTLTPITPNSIGALAHHPVLAQLENFAGDACPDLVLSGVGATGVVIYNGSMNAALGSNKHCILDTVATAITLDKLTDPPVVIGRITLKPQFLFIGADALLLPQGIWGYFGPTKTAGPIYVSTRPLRGAVCGDFNNDGLVDGILIPDGQDDLDLLYRYHTPSVDGFQFLRVDTATQADNVVLRDFDGNGFLDLMYTEHAGDHDRMMIAYGTTDRLLPPAQVATFDSVARAASISLPSSADPLSLSADLIVTDTDASSVILLLGSPQRTMIPLLDPRSGKDPMNPVTADVRGSTTFRGAAIGNFAVDPGPVQFADAIALATRDATAAGTAIPAVSGWRIAGSADGLDTTQSAGNAVGNLISCASTSTTPAANQMCTEATYIAYPTPQHDAIIGVDRFNHVAIGDPTVMPFGVTVSSAFGAAGDGTLNTLFAADVDGDGTAEIVAAFGAGLKPTSSKGAVLVCSANAATGSPTTCHDVAAEYVGPFDSKSTTCVGVAAGRFGFVDHTTTAAPPLDLVVACHGAIATSLYRIEPSNGNRVTKLVGDLPLQLDLIRAGDINGDGIDDVVVIQGEAGAQMLTVFQQCTSRDATCREAP